MHPLAKLIPAGLLLAVPALFSGCLVGHDEGTTPLDALNGGAVTTVDAPTIPVNGPAIIRISGNGLHEVELDVAKPVKLVAAAATFPANGSSRWGLQWFLLFPKADERFFAPGPSCGVVPADMRIWPRPHFESQWNSSLKPGKWVMLAWFTSAADVQLELDANKTTPVLATSHPSTRFTMQRFVTEPKVEIGDEFYKVQFNQTLLFPAYGVLLTTFTVEGPTVFNTFREHSNHLYAGNKVCRERVKDQIMTGDISQNQWQLGMNVVAGPNMKWAGLFEVRSNDHPDQTRFRVEANSVTLT